MKLLSILAIFTLCVVVKGWVAILQPIVLSLGAAFTALNIDADLIPNIQSIKFFKKKTDTHEMSRGSDQWGIINYFKGKKGKNKSKLEKRNKAKADKAKA